MAKSQNGWVVLTTNKGTTSLSYITGRVKSGDVYIVLSELAKQYHASVEKITRAHSWGWHYRKIRGGQSYSNHASATAVDFNAPKHPLGASGTFSKRQVAAINQILRNLGGVVRWGGHYSGRKDEMHFEINASAASVKKIADILRAKYAGTTAKSATTASGKLAENGILNAATIKRWQKAMGTTQDGKISTGRNGSSLIKAAQRKLNKYGHKLKVDGFLGKKTITAMQHHLGTKPVDGRISRSAKGSNVIRALQRKLNTKGYF